MGDCTTKENFVPARAGLLFGLKPIEIIAQHLGVPVEAIRQFSIREDPCHIGWFINDLRVKVDG